MSPEHEDMADVGSAFMEAIEQARTSNQWVRHWSPAQCPSEIIFDLLNRIDDMQIELEVQRKCAVTRERHDRREILLLLQSSSCFRGDVCSSLPCACAETIAAYQRS
jgi:hypothetical protein